MRGVTLEAKMRAVGRALKAEVTLHEGPMGKYFAVACPELDKPSFQDGGDTLRIIEIHFKRLSGAEKALKALHEAVYHSRGQFVYEQQLGTCCFCGRRMPEDAWEIDHKESRGAHGRDDRIGNLQVCCTGFNGCDGHRRKHGG